VVRCGTDLCLLSLLFLLAAGCQEVVIQHGTEPSPDLDWREVGPEEWPAFESHIREQAALGSEGVPPVTPLGSVPAEETWGGGVLAPDGRIFGIPDEATTILEIDPEGRTVRTFGSVPVGTDKWRGGVLAFDGKIYAVPRDADSILEIDPSSGLISTDVEAGGEGANKWYGAVLGPNGRVYGIPYDETRVLEYDPAARSVRLFGDFAGSEKWRGGVLAPNGLIYGIPQAAASILVIDPAAGSATTFAIPATGDEFRGGVLGPNGLIYAIPATAAVVLEIDSAVESVRSVATVAASASAYSGGAMAADGTIFGSPFDGNEVLAFTVPSTMADQGTVAGIDGTPTANSLCSGMTLGLNGMLYLIPFRAETVYEIDPRARGRLDPNVALSPYYNKF
jgi:outer membrane protein assembly factor BamB